MVLKLVHPSTCHSFVAGDFTVSRISLCVQQCTWRLNAIFPLVFLKIAASTKRSSSATVKKSISGPTEKNKIIDLYGSTMLKLEAVVDTLALHLRGDFEHSCNIWWTYLHSCRRSCGINKPTNLCVSNSGLKEQEYGC